MILDINSITVFRPEAIFITFVFVGAFIFSMRNAKILVHWHKRKNYLQNYCYSQVS